MILLDTDVLVLLATGHAKVVKHLLAASDVVAITIVTRIEVLRARYEFLMKAADAEQLQRAPYWLDRSEADLSMLPTVRIDADAAFEFDRLRQLKRLRKIGRADLLIASIALARHATVVTNNQKHFAQIPNLRLENWTE